MNLVYIDLFQNKMLRVIWLYSITIKFWKGLKIFSVFLSNSAWVSRKELEVNSEAGENFTLHFPSYFFLLILL